MTAAKTDRTDTGGAAAERILEAGVGLFARQGYSATGVRDIAREAGVNLSMISYYFGGKAGLLEAVVNRFFDGYAEVVAPVIESRDEVAEAKVRKLLRTVIGFLRTRQDELRVVITELPLELPHLASLKAERIGELMPPILRTIIGELGPKLTRPPRLEILGPTVGGILMFHFLMQPVLSRVFDGIEFNDEFYETYPDEIANLLLHGLLGQPERGGQV